MLVFIAAILTVFIIFVIIYIVTGQSKLKALVATMALQRVRALNTNRQTQNCNSELLKILMILNLVIVVSLLLRKIKKSVFFSEDNPFPTW